MFADMSNLPPLPTQRGGDPELFHAELLYEINAAIADHPRSKQQRIGPSELGTPCARRVGYKLAGVEPVNVDRGAWKPTVGTAVHQWLYETFLIANRRYDSPRWLLEHMVSVGDVGGVEITGSCDLYDRVTCTVVDWKILGLAGLKAKKEEGHPGEQYRAQLHLYGRGWTRRGMPVDRVALAAFPQNGELSDGWYWSEAYSEDVALAALSRADGAAALVAAAGTAALPMLGTADSFCTYCPHYLPASTELEQACPGHLAAATIRPHAA